MPESRNLPSWEPRSRDFELESFKNREILWDLIFDWCYLWFKDISGSWKLKISVLQRILIVAPRISLFLKRFNSKSPGVRLSGWQVSAFGFQPFIGMSKKKCFHTCFKYSIITMHCQNLPSFTPLNVSLFVYVLFKKICSETLDKSCQLLLKSAIFPENTWKYCLILIRGRRIRNYVVSQLAVSNTIEKFKKWGKINSFELFF